MKRITGFIMGVLLVTGIWYGLGGLEEMTPSRAKSKAKDRVEQAVQMVQKTVKQQEGIKNPDPADSRTETEKNEDQDSKSPAEKSSEKREKQSSGAAELQEPALPVAENGPDSGEIDNVPENSPGAAESAKETVPQGLHASIAKENPGKPESSAKQFFWQPFELESRAKGFAGHIKEKSGVVCRLEKNKPGTYRVYFRYTDDADRRDKIQRIENTGVVLQID